MLIVITVEVKKVVVSGIVRWEWEFELNGFEGIKVFFALVIVKKI